MRSILCIFLLFVVFSFAGCTAGAPSVGLKAKLKAESLVAQGVRDAYQGNFDEAKASFLASYEVMANAEALDGLGCIALVSGDYAAAESYFNRVRQEFPDYPNVLVNMGVLADIQGKKDLAKQYYKMAIELEPDKAVARGNYGSLVFELGDKLLGRSETLKALALDRGNEVFRKNLNVMDEKF